MSRDRITLALIGIGLLTSVVSAGLVRLFVPMTLWGFLGCVVSLGFINVPALLVGARSPQPDRCTAWLLRRLSAF